MVSLRRVTEQLNSRFRAALSAPFDQETEIKNLQNFGFIAPRFFIDDHWAAIITIGSFVCIVDGNKMCLRIGYRSYWAYRSVDSALDALNAWSGEGEPKNFMTRRLSSEYHVWP